MAASRAPAVPGNGWQIARGLLLVLRGILAVMMLAGAALATALVFVWMLVVPLAGVTSLALPDGLLSIVLAILIAIGWPQSSLVLIGLLTGVVADLDRRMADRAGATRHGPTRAPRAGV